MLFPQYEYAFDKTISKTVWENLQKQAKESIKDTEHVSDTVIKHWQSIIDGVVPFGYIVVNND